jgi:hypothetical protein
MHTAIQNKRSGMLTCGVILLDDNARPHTAASRFSTDGTFSMRVVWPTYLQPWSHSERIPPVYSHTRIQKSLRGFSPLANYIDRATAARQRSLCKLFGIKGVM